jgi:hypothetical protein
VKESAWITWTEPHNPRSSIGNVTAVFIVFAGLYSLVEYRVLVQTWVRASHVVKSPGFPPTRQSRLPHISGVAFGRPHRVPSLNWFLLIFAASSIPLIVTAAV